MMRFLLAVLVVAIVGSAISVVYARHRHRQLVVVLARVGRARGELTVAIGRVELEQATLSESNRIEAEATGRLGMKFPETADIVVVRP